MNSENIYSYIRAFRDKEIGNKQESNSILNRTHDSIIEKVLDIAIETTNRDIGPPPAAFCFFVMGSAGRCEQGIWSDQDHGIIFEGKEPGLQSYFLALGTEISKGLEKAGYKKCDGNVMSCNPMWCRSTDAWVDQLNAWMLEATWQTIRHLLTFIDARCLYGHSRLLEVLKNSVFDSIHMNRLMLRIAENTMHIKKGVGVLGQLIVETHGPFTGAINIKDIGLFPYVNAARILAIHGRISETSTIARIRKIPDSILPANQRLYYEFRFSKLLDFRLAFSNHSGYESGHFIHPAKLTKEQKKELRSTLLAGGEFYDAAKKLVEREYRYGNE